MELNRARSLSGVAHEVRAKTGAPPGSQKTKLENPTLFLPILKRNNKNKKTSL